MRDIHPSQKEDEEPNSGCWGEFVVDETQLQSVYLSMYLTGGQTYANAEAHVRASTFFKVEKWFIQV